MCYLIAICIIVYFYIGVGACLFPRKLGFYFSAKMMVLVFLFWWVVPFIVSYELFKRHWYK